MGNTFLTQIVRTPLSLWFSFWQLDGPVMAGTVVEGNWIEANFKAYRSVLSGMQPDHLPLLFLSWTLKIIKYQPVKPFFWKRALLISDLWFLILLISDAWSINIQGKLLRSRDETDLYETGDGGRANACCWTRSFKLDVNVIYTDELYIIIPVLLTLIKSKGRCSIGVIHQVNNYAFFSSSAFSCLF